MNYKGHEIQIEPDEDAESPREWDNLGTLVTFHKRHNIGEDYHYEMTAELRDAAEKVYASGLYVWLPVFMMDHSGLSLSTSAEGYRACDPQGWDWGQLGYIYAKRGAEDMSDDALRKALIQEIEALNQWLQGDVWGYSIAGLDDSCWGIFGYDYCLAEAQQAVDAHLDAAGGRGP